MAQYLVQLGQAVACARVAFAQADELALERVASAA
jgi:hypothetical protein